MCQEDLRQKQGDLVVFGVLGCRGGTQSVFASDSITEAREALPQEGDRFSPASFQKLYKSSWENQKAKGFELRLDSLAFLAAKANRDLASEVSRCSMNVTIFHPGESERVCAGSSAL